MRYPIAIELGSTEQAYGIVAPDLPGCFSAGDTLEEATANALEAIAAWVDAALDEGDPIPAPSSLDLLRDDPRFEGWLFGVVSVEANAI
jgi:predicted RNase H-like HicB family nuclease